jgi:hypothetical protein
MHVVSARLHTQSARVLRLQDLVGDGPAVGEDGGANGVGDEPGVGDEVAVGVVGPGLGAMQLPRPLRPVGGVVRIVVGAVERGGD